MIQRARLAASVTRASKTLDSEGCQPGFQNSASSETNGMPVASERRRAKVDLPDPDEPMTRMRCMASFRKSARQRRARRPQLGKIIAGVMRRASQGARRYHQETLGVGDFFEPCELVRRHVTHHGVMLAGRLQILPDGEKIDLGAAQMFHPLQHRVPHLPETDDDPGFAEEGSINLLDPLQQPDRMEIARA